MSATDARQVLNCYDSSGRVRTTTIGNYAQEVDRFLTEISPDRLGYWNMLVWTRGDERNCADHAGSGATELAANLQPDDIRFRPWVFSGALYRTWPQCFLRVKDQIVLLLGGAPQAKVVIGIWRLSVPAEGRRPSLAGLIEQLNTRYPMLAIDASRVTEDAPFVADAFMNSQGQRLDAEQIARDYVSLTPPAQPIPPPTTESCGFFRTCQRTPTPAEQSNYAIQMRAYQEGMVAYQQRRVAADAYGRCVSSPLRSTGQLPLNDTDRLECGPIITVAARPYPGGFTEAYFVAVYDHRAALRGRLQLQEYVRDRRGQRSPTAGAVPPV